MNMHIDKDKLEEIVDHLEHHTGLTRYMRIGIQPQTLIVESIDPQQVSDPNAPPNREVYAGILQPDIILKWFRKSLEPSIRRDVKFSEIRAICLNASLVPIPLRTAHTELMKREFGTSWHTSMKAVQRLAGLIEAFCDTHAICPFCGAHETFTGKLSMLTCMSCRGRWDASDPLNAHWT